MSKLANEVIDFVELSSSLMEEGGAAVDKLAKQASTAKDRVPGLIDGFDKLGYVSEGNHEKLAAMMGDYEGLLTVCGNCLTFLQKQAAELAETQEQLKQARAAAGIDTGKPDDTQPAKSASDDGPYVGGRGRRMPSDTQFEERLLRGRNK